MNIEISETAQIIQFAAARPKLAKGQRPKTGGFSTNPPITRDEEGLTETAKNYRLRRARYDDWREADAVMDYWHIRMKMDTAVSRVQHCNAPEGDLHPVRDPKGYWTLVARYRQAWARLMLTPAPTVREITWKRAQLKAENQKHTGLKIEWIEQAIADDVEFLKSHPTRRRDLEQ
jgi:hypothetical protein